MAQPPASLVATVPPQHMYGFETTIMLPLWAPRTGTSSTRSARGARSASSPTKPPRSRHSFARSIAAAVPSGMTDAARAALRDAVRAAGGDCSLRATVFAPDFDPRRPDRPLLPVLLASTAPPSALPASPLRVCSTVFSRPLPQVKHIDTFPLFHLRRVALRAGFDDALFVDADGRIGEGSTWNIGFWDGQSVVWPAAPALRGTAEALLCDGLDVLGIARQVREVRLADLSRFHAAFACNATGVMAVASVDGVALADSESMLPTWQRAMQALPLERL